MTRASQSVSEWTRNVRARTQYTKEITVQQHLAALRIASLHDRASHGKQGVVWSRAPDHSIFAGLGAGCSNKHPCRLLTRCSNSKPCRTRAMALQCGSLIKPSPTGYSSETQSTSKYVTFHRDCQISWERPQSRRTSKPTFPSSTWFHLSGVLKFEF